MTTPTLRPESTESTNGTFGAPIPNIQNERSQQGEPPKAGLLLEASWEVCNKVGGIYTVVKSKVPVIQSHYPQYILLGPYIESMAKREFTPEKDAPAWVSQAFEKA